MAKRTEGAQPRRMARQEYPEDRFDSIGRSGRVGAHRVTARPRYTWQYLIAGLLGFALLTTLGIIAVHTVGSTGQTPLRDAVQGGSSPAQQTPDAVLDPEASIAILNGTATQNLAPALDTIITTEKWGSILFSGNAASADVQISAVFYADPADASAAAGLAAKLGGLSTYASTDYEQYEARLVVLLGSDYQGPGISEAEALTAKEAAGNADSTVSVDRAVDPDAEGSEGAEIDPGTGFPIDPATGLAVDPATGRTVDPATGETVAPAAE